MSGFRRVLVADDDPDIRTLLSFNLTAEGFDVLPAADGDEAWSLARNAAPDLIVLDVMMPHRDGLDVLASLKSHPRTREVPVVLLTARTTDADVWEGWRAGADYYMSKPFNLDEFLRFVDCLLRPTAVPVAGA